MTASRAPWWLTWLLVGGLVLVFLGQRILAVTPVTWLGVGVVLAATLWRALSWRRASGEARSMEGLLLLAQIGCVLALALYALGRDAALGAVGPDFATAEAEARFRAGLRVAWSLVLGLSLLPLLGAAWAVGMRRSSGEADEVEALRVRETAAGGLTLALAASALVLLGWVAQERDRTLDLSYFRTASPGSTTEEIVSSLENPLQVLVFFPQVNEVKDQVLTYFEALANATDRVEIQEYDRVQAPEVAREHRVTADGTVILSSGEVEERLTVPTQLASARGLLRRLDSEIQNRLLRLLRGRRIVYLTVGHGELNDPSSAGPLEGEREDTGVQALKEILGLLNYDVQDLGIGSGLGREVPDDAAAVLVLGPLRPFLDEELESLDAYLAGGGSLLLAVDPDTDFPTGPLERRLGVAVNPVPLADDAQHLRRRGNLSDRRLLVTDRFSSHASVSTLSRMGVGSGIVLFGTGSVDEVEGPGEGQARRSFIIRTLPSTFDDLDRDFEFDPPEEERMSWPVAAAVETPRPEEGSGEGMRALVFADADLFGDLVLRNVGLNGALVADGLRWLGREEELAGETTSEEDVAIVHTRAEDVAWFYSTIVGAPALVLLAGLLGIWLRRRRRGGGEA